MNERPWIKSLIKSRRRELPSLVDKEPPIDPIKALQHIKTLAHSAQDSTDIDLAHKHFEMILTLVDKALPRKK